MRVAELKESSKYYLELKHNIDTLLIEWEQLLSGMELRKQVLYDVLYLQKSIHNFEETISWIVDIESTISSENFGKDLSSVQLLLREHEMVGNTQLAIKVKLFSYSSFHYSYDLIITFSFLMKLIISILSIIRTLSGLLNKPFVDNKFDQFSKLPLSIQWTLVNPNTDKAVKFYLAQVFVLARDFDLLHISTYLVWLF